ncbi:MAG: MBL fold metallo-hydrolase, partial [Alphaproteobacteria bacterium]
LSTNDIPLVFISHLHGDHFGGLPFLLIDAMYPRQRKTPLVFAGPPGLENRFRMACEVFYPSVAATPPKFDLQFIELEKNMRHEIGDVVVTPTETDHASGAPSYAYRFEKDGKIFAFSGDAGWSDAVIEAGRGADLYLLECYQYDLHLPMHLDYVTIDQHFEQIDAKCILLTHMGDGMLTNLCSAS